MARKRMIHPSLITSRSVGQLTVPQRYGWIALILHLDDQGRAVDDLPVLRAAMWPRDSMTTKKLDADLKAYARLGLICRYPDPATGERYLHAPNWDDYQKVQYPSRERVPGCPLHDLNLHETFVSDLGVVRENFVCSVVKSSSIKINEVDVDDTTYQRVREAALRDGLDVEDALAVARSLKVRAG